MEKILLGPYTIYSFDSPPDLVDHTIEKIKKLDYQKVGSSEVNNNVISIGYELRDGKKVNFYDEKFYSHLYTCIKQVEEIHLVNSKLKIVDIWGVKAKFGDQSVSHNHNNSMFSGVFYFTSCKRSQLVFTLEDQFAKKWEFIFDSNLKRNPVELKITPEKGKLYIFPSFLVHKVLPHSEPFDRYSLAFNTFIEIEDEYATRKISLNCN